MHFQEDDSNFLLVHLLVHVYKGLQLLHRENRNYNSIKMFLMSDFSPALVFLANIYADGFSNRQTTEVYGNSVMQVSVFVSVNYNGDVDGIEDEIKDYVRDNAVIFRLRDDGSREKVDWVYSETSNGFPHDIEYRYNSTDRGGSSSDIRTPFYFTVPPDSEGKQVWIAILGLQETSTSAPLTINVREFKPFADGSQFEFVKRLEAKDHENILCVLRYKAGAFPETQKLMKAYKYKGIKFNGTGGNSWLAKYNTTVNHNSSAIFVEYKKNHINVAMNYHVYQPNEYQSDLVSGITLHTYPSWAGPTLFSPSDIEDAWIDGVVIVQSKTELVFFFGSPPSLGGIPLFPFLPFQYETYEFQDNFGNIVAIEFDWGDEGSGEGDDWKVKSAIVLYPE